MAVAAKNCAQEEEASRLSPSCTLSCECVGKSVRVSVDVALVTLTCAVLRGCGQVETVELEHANAVCLFAV